MPFGTYTDRHGEHRWRAVADNGRIVADSAEGYEHRIVEGADELLRECQFVIAEVSITRPYAGGSSFADFIALMDRHGFAVHDLLDGLKRGNGGVEFVDVMFRQR